MFRESWSVGSKFEAENTQTHSQRLTHLNRKPTVLLFEKEVKLQQLSVVAISFFCL